MTITDDSATIGSAEYYLFSDSTSKTNQTTDGELQVMLDVAALAAGDTYEVAFYETVGGNQRKETWTFGASTSGLWISPILKVGNAYEVSLKKLTGTDRAIGWSLRLDTASGGGGDATAANQATIIAALAVIDDFLDTEIAAIKTVTDGLNAQLATIDDFLDTEIASISSRLPAALVSGRIDASVGAMAANTVTASAVAADAVTELQSGLALSTQVDGVESGVADIQARLPAALVGGRIDASVGAMAADVVTAAAIATDALDLDAFAADAEAAFSAGGGGGGGGDATAANQATILAALDVIDNLLDTEIASIKTTVEALPSAAANAAAVWAETAATSLIAAVAALPTAAANAAATATAVLAGTVEAGFSLARTLSIIASSVAGKRTISGTTTTMRNLGDTQNQVVGTSDADGNRTAATYGA